MRPRTSSSTCATSCDPRTSSATWSTRSISSLASRSQRREHAMPLPTPNLDDRQFQDILDEARRRIPVYCPEWTDHNLSDPGITMLELFAWMTDMLLYRLNRVPDKNYVKFLDLIGIKLQPARAATTNLTVRLSAAQPEDVIIPRGTEVATVRTETIDA